MSLGNALEMALSLLVLLMIASCGKSGGGCIGVSGCAGGGATNFNNPLGIAVDGSGNVWVSNQSSVTELLKSSSYSASSAVNISGGTTNFNFLYGIAIDGSGNVWVPNYGNNSVTEILKSSNYSASTAVNIK